MIEAFGFVHSYLCAVVVNRPLFYIVKIRTCEFPGQPHHIDKLHLYLLTTQSMHRISVAGLNLSNVEYFRESE